MPHVFLDRVENAVTFGIWMLFFILLFLLVASAEVEVAATTAAMEEDGEPAGKEFNDRMYRDQVPAKVLDDAVRPCPQTAVEDADEIFEFFGVSRECIV